MKRLLSLLGLLTRYPAVSAVVVTLLTLLAGAVVIVLADFGASIWIFLPLLLWLGTVGAPSTLGVLAVASLWGRWPDATGLGLFALCAGWIGFGLQLACLLALRRWFGPKRKDASCA